MAIERFSKEEFEAALPRHRATGAQLCSHVGVVDNEHTYLLQVQPLVFVSIRSSIRPNGVAASTGEDSIRAWLADADGRPLGSKIQSYTTRKPGWGERLEKILRELYKRGQRLHPCPTCGKMMGVYQCKKDGPNKGRLFSKCWEHSHFYWLDEQSAPTKPEIKASTATKREDIVGLLAQVGTVKGRVELLRELLSGNASHAVWGLQTIYSYQTEHEKAAAQTMYDNGVGFSGVDGEILTSFAKQQAVRGTLSPKQMGLVFKKMPRYAVQLEKHLRGEILQMAGKPVSEAANVD